MKWKFISLVLLFIQLLIAQVADPSLVAWYPFNGNTNDASGNGHNASSYSAYFTSDIHGNANSAIYFTPDSCYIHIPYDSELQLSQFSLCGWVKCQFVGYYSSQTVICRGENVNGDSESLNYLLDIVRDTHQSMIRFEDANENLIAISTTQLLETNQWHFLVSTYNGDSLKIFIDGYEAVGVYGINAPGSNSQPLTIGAQFVPPYAYTNNFSGTLDEIRIYNRALSNGEVYNLYLDGLPGLVRDSLALVALYNSTDGDNWDPPVNWTTSNFNGWDGISIDPAVSRVTGIALSNRNLNGTIPYDIGYLDSLQLLDLYDNPNLSGEIPTTIGSLSALINLGIYNTTISGSIPSEIGQLTKLSSCNLSDNQLSGLIPDEICNLTSLTGLYLFNNQLTGSIPANIGNMTALVNLSLQGNQLAGTIPVSICNLTNLIWLYLFDNQLTGSIPDNIGNISALEYLNLNDNQLSGSIPTSIGSLSNLIVLGLWNNQLTGSIPSEIGNLSNVEVISLWNNQTISGQIPSSIGFLSTLKELHLGNNSLSGTIPAEIGGLIAVKTLNIENNNLSGSIPTSISSLLKLENLALYGNTLSGNIPAAIGFDTSLVNIDLSDNQLDGAIPAAIGNLFKLQILKLHVNQLSGNLPAEFWNLRELRECVLYINQLTGTLPEEIGNLDSLEILDLGDNNFTGALPAAFTSLSKLRTVWIGTNDLTGPLPSDIGNMTNLEQLALYLNSIDGPIPSSIVNCSKLNLLILNDNKLSGSIPTDMGNLLNLEELNLGGNSLTGSIPTSILSCSKLKILYLYNNQLDGEIPTDIGNLSNLVELNLHNNNFAGSIPTSISSCSNLTFLDLWANQITGTIPSEIGLLTQLQHFSVSGNQMQGEIPSEIYTLSNLTFLAVDGNSFTGSIPTTINNLVNLETLYMGWNSLSGNIPSELGELTNLKILYLGHGNFTGSLPSELGNLTSLEDFRIESNNLSGDIPSGFSNFSNIHTLYLNDNSFNGLPDLSSLPLTDLQIQDNLFTFEDIEPNIGLSGFTYAPQDSVGTKQSHTMSAGESYTMNVAVGGNNNTYQWFKDDNPVPNATSSTYQVVNADALDTGIYTCRITNTVVTELTLWRRPVTVFVSGTAPPVPVLLTPGNNADEVQTNPTFTWRQATGATEYDFQLASNSDFSDIVLQESGITQTDYSPTGLDDGQTFYWHVKARNTFGESDWSSAWQFTTVSNLPVPDTPTLASPANGAVGQKLTVDLTWNKAANASIYVLEVADNSSFSTLFKEGTDITNEAYRLEGLSYGTTYYWRVFASNGRGDSQWSDVWNFTTYNLPGVSIQTPTELTPVTVVLNGLVNPNGLETSVAFEIGQSTTYGRTVDAEQSPFSGTTETEFSAFVDQLFIGTTYHFRIVATNEAGTVTSGDATFTTKTYPAEYTLAHSTSFPAKSEPRDYQSADYRMIGLPGNSNLAVKELISGEPEKDWMVVWDNGNDSNYFIRFSDSNVFNFLPGRAFWVVAKSAININRTVSTASLGNEDEVQIQVHNGWNLITSPFDTTVSWTYVQQYNGISRPIWQFNGSYNQVSTMQPFQGYYYFHEPNSTTLSIPLHAAYARIHIDNDPPFAWQLRMALVTDHGTENCAVIGVAEQSLADMDEYDFRKPRAPGDIPGICFLRPNWDKKYQYFIRDIRPAVDKIEKWDFEVTARRHENCQLYFSGIYNIPEEEQVYCIDMMHAAYQDLREDTIYNYQSEIEKSPFALLVGDENAVQDELRKILPHEFTLGNNFPNPFNPVTTIPVSIPENAFVTIKIYNILGQEVATVFRGVLNTGKHYITWDGRRCASGVYYCRLQSQTGKSAIHKMVLIK